MKSVISVLGRLSALTAIFLLSPSFGANGDEPGAAAAIASLKSLIPTATPDLVEKSQVPGFFDVVVNGQVVLISADGRYIMQGDVFDMASRSSLTSRAQQHLRQSVLKDLPASKRLIFTPQNRKYSVVVFTDVDCPYCRQFHKQIDAYLQRGIEVQYVLFPLDIHPGADSKAAALWCAKDRHAAYTAAMNGIDPGNLHCSNPVAETKALAVKLGIGGTPTALGSDGRQLPPNVVMNPELLAAELARIAPQN